MRKRKWMIGIGILVVCVLTGVLAMFCLKQYRVKQAVRIYQEFIEGKRTAGGWNIKEISTPTGEPNMVGFINILNWILPVSRPMKCFFRGRVKRMTFGHIRMMISMSLMGRHVLMRNGMP